jgi:hypothetical protein
MLVNPRLLLSYWYFKGADLQALLGQSFGETLPDLFSDSGAFSAYTKNEVIDPNQYAEWLFKWGHLFTVYANLDVKGDWRAGMKNLAILEAKGLHPLPVFHGGEPFDLLSELVTQYPYIALGGLSGQTASGSPEMMRFIIRCFQIAQGKSVFHGFGMTNVKVMRLFPWYSCDSTSWISASRFGIPLVLDERSGRLIQMQLGDRRRCYSQATILREWGFDPEDYADRRRNSTIKNITIGLYSSLKTEAWMRKLWGEIFIPGHPELGSGMRLYNVAGNDWWIGKTKEACVQIEAMNG